MSKALAASMLLLATWAVGACGSGEGGADGVDASASEGSAEGGPDGLEGASSAGSVDGGEGSATRDGTSGSPDLPWQECDDGVEDCGDGEKCVPRWDQVFGTWLYAACVPIDPDPVALYEACRYDGLPFESRDNCPDRSFCMDVGTDGEGFCIGTCDDISGDRSCEDPAAVCVPYGNPFRERCQPKCDPRPGAESCLGDNGRCDFDSGAAAFVCGTFPGQSPGLGEPCQAPFECPQGAGCVQGLSDCAGTSCCAAFCDPEDPVCPVQGQTCEELSFQPPPVDSPGLVGRCW